MSFGNWNQDMVYMDQFAYKINQTNLHHNLVLLDPQLQGLFS